MNFSPFLSQLQPDSDYGWKLPKSLTLAALGVTDSQLARLRGQLVEGIHLFKDRRANNRVTFTLSGLLELSALLNTDRSKGFRDALLRHTRNQSAMTHQPRGEVVWQRPQTSDLSGFETVSGGVMPCCPDWSTQTPGMLGFQGDALRELVQLKRDEIELARSQEETRRLELLQLAYQEGFRSEEGASRSQEQPAQVNVVIHQGGIRQWVWLPDGTIAAAAVVTFYLFAMALICFMGIAASQPRIFREVPTDVRYQ